MTALPAQIAGVNTQEYIADANSVSEDVYNNKSTSQAALLASAIYRMQKPISVSNNSPADFKAQYDPSYC